MAYAPLAACAVLLGRDPFWAAKPPEKWSDQELQELLNNSPWAQAPAMSASSGGVQVYLATARPMREAEREVARRQPPQRPDEDPNAGEYEEFLRQNPGKYVVLAVLLPNAGKALADEVEARRMQEECILRVGRKKFKMTGYFPPSPSDPYVRLVYPRVVGETDKSFTFELYLPLIPGPYRSAEFRVKELLYKGALEM